MTVTPASFRVDFPAFTNATIYPDGSVTFWLGVATKLLSGSVSVGATRWADMLDVGIELFTAHQLALEKQANDTAVKGGTPGISSGPVASKGVGPVSIGYDTTAGLELDAGHWNLTVYGTRFINLARMVGSGGWLV